MRSYRPALLAACLLGLAGCMVSEQIGEMPQDLTFHFDTSFNRILLFGRSMGLAVVGLWVLSAWKKNVVGILVGVVLFAAAGWFFFQDYPSLKGYRVQVLARGLQLNVPPEPELFVAWSSIERLDLAGYEWAQVGGSPGVSPFGRSPQYAWSELPEWETMDITTHEGDVYTINLKRLSIEQRQILSQAIVKRAHLIKE